MEQFRSCIHSNIHEATGGFKFKMDFKLNLDLTKESYHVCRKVFAYCWRMSEYEVKQISKALKGADSGFVESYTTRAFTDDTNLGKT